jgi:hypothetical protein
MEIRQFEKLQQRRYFSRCTYEILKDGVEVDFVSPLQRRKYKIAYENVAENAMLSRVSSRAAFWLTLAFAVLGILTAAFTPFIPASLAMFALGFIALVYLRLSFCEMTTYGSLTFLKDRPSHALLVRFVGLMQARRRDYLRESYLLGSDLAALSADAIQKLVWLKQQGAINEAEFERLKADVIERSRWSVAQPPSSN